MNGILWRGGQYLPGPTSASSPAAASSSPTNNSCRFPLFLPAPANPAPATRAPAATALAEGVGSLQHILHDRPAVQLRGRQPKYRVCPPVPLSAQLKISNREEDVASVYRSTMSSQSGNEWQGPRGG